MSELDLDVNQQRRALADEMRKGLALSLGQPEDRLAELTLKLATLNAELESNYEQPKPFIASSPHQAVKAIYMDTPAGGQYNPLSCPGTSQYENGKLTRRINFPHSYHGPRDMVHGGILSMVYDDMFGLTTALNNLQARTVKLEVQYQAPTLIQTDLLFTAEVDNVDGRKVTMKGECWCGDKLLTLASALFITVQSKS